MATEQLLALEELEKIPGKWSSVSPINGKGLLLDTVQRSGIFPDSKTFVDMPMKDEPDVILEKFQSLFSLHNGKIPTSELKTYIDEHFFPPGQELEAWELPDWKESPTFLDTIEDPDLKTFGRSLNGLWKTLGRKMKTLDVHKTSLLYVPNGFVVPGDRFREIYYWDTYWIVKGLLVSGMPETTRGVIGNLLHMVKQYGMVPNGGRSYYTNRSQPPLLSAMVEAYYDDTGDLGFVRDNFHLLKTEHKFWLDNQSVTFNKDGQSFTLAQYRVKLTHPRVEGYIEDLKAASGFSPERAAQLFTDLASVAASGWDFSTRWFHWEGENSLDPRGAKTTDIIPVDLNTFLYMTEKILAKFATLLGETESAESFTTQASIRLSAMQSVFWHEDDGMWYDYDYKTGVTRRRFYISNITPLLTHPDTDRVNKVVQYLEQHGLLDYPGGVPCSNIESGQQWDFPNAWPPNVEILITGLAGSDSEHAQKLAVKLAQTWVSTNYVAWRCTGNMFEKYDVRTEGGIGGGGEYVNQVGFGWTNSVILQLLHNYGNSLHAPRQTDTA